MVVQKLEKDGVACNGKINLNNQHVGNLNCCHGVVCWGRFREVGAARGKSTYFNLLDGSPKSGAEMILQVRVQQPASPVLLTQQLNKRKTVSKDQKGQKPQKKKGSSKISY